MSFNLGLLVTPLNPTTIDDGTSSTYLGIVDLGGALTISGAGTDVTTFLLANALGGNITVDNGATFDVAGAALGFGANINIGADGTLVEGGTSLNFLSPINFTGADGNLDLQNLAGFSQTESPITGFQLGDTITVYTPINGASYNSSTDTLSLTENGHAVGSLSLLGIGLDAGFTVTPNGSGGYEIAVACFLPGTRILTERGEVAIEHIAIGDRVVTLSGEAKPVKWIGRRSYSASVVAGEPHVAPVLIRQNALADGLPRRDLYLSPCHAMYVDGVLIESAHLINGVSVLRSSVDAQVEYYNLEFEDHEVIFAEGAAAETGCSRGNRVVYDNAHEYDALYPHEAQGLIKPYCAPRLDCGFVVEAVRQRIDARAGLAAPAAERLGELKGWIENLDGGSIKGIAFNAESDAPVVLEIAIDGEVVGEVIANHLRTVRVDGAVREGRIGFNVKLPEGLSPYRRHSVSVRRAADKAELFGAPYMMEAATPLSIAGCQRLGAALHDAAANAASVAEVDRVIAFLAAKAEGLLQARADLAHDRAGYAALRPHPGQSTIERRAA